MRPRGAPPGARRVAWVLALGAFAQAGAAPSSVSVVEGSDSGSPPTALRRLAKLAASQMAEQSAIGPIAIYVVARSTALAQAFSTLLASELAQRKLAPIALDDINSDSAEDVARRSGARSLARLRLAVNLGTLKVEGDLLATWVNFWSGSARTRAPQPAGVVDVSTEADAQVSSLIASSPQEPVPGGEEKPFELVGALVARLPLPPAAVASGDLDGDGTDEVLVLTDEEVIALTLNGKILARREHRNLPPSPTPCREPFGTIVAVGQPARIAYFSAQREKGELLELDMDHAAFRPVTMIDQVPLGQIGEDSLQGRFTPGRNSFVWEGFANERQKAPISALSLFPTPSGFHLLLVFPNGSANWIQMRRGIRSSAPLERLGAGSALVDVDGDGTPELITTSARYRPNPDELRVLGDVPVGSSKAGPLTLRWQSAIPRGRILQVAAARLGRSANGRQEQGAVLGIWLPDGTGEIQLFRRGSP